MCTGLQDWEELLLPEIERQQELGTLYSLHLQHIIPN